MAGGEVVAKLGVKRESGYLSYVKGTELWKSPMKRAGGDSAAGKGEKVASANFKRDDGYLYFLDKAGNIARKPRSVGGQKRKKAAGKKAPAAKKAPVAAKKAAPAKKPAAKKAAPAKKPVAKAKKRS